MTDEPTTVDVEEKEAEKDLHGHEIMFVEGVSSFAELQSMRQSLDNASEVRALTGDFSALVDSIMSNPEEANKGQALSELAVEFSNIVQETMERKERWQPLTNLAKKAIDKVTKKAYSPLDVTLGIPELTTQKPFQLTKQTDGSYRWFAIYSNKFRDEDTPPEIIAEASHKRFEKMVDAGEAEYPELWIGHIEDFRIGVADLVAWDDEGFAVAAGTIDTGKETIAENLANEENVLVSHGMPVASIERDAEDPTIIIGHITKEISALPQPWEAANKLTGFEILNEVKEMALSDDKRQKLEQLGFSVAEVEAVAESKAAEADEAELESKETETPALAETEAPTEQPETDNVSRDELTEVVAAIGQSHQVLTEALMSLTKKIEGLEKTDEEKIKETLEATPAASLSSLFASAIGSDEARIDGRTVLAKDGPKETPPEALGETTGIRFLDKLTAQ